MENVHNSSTERRRVGIKQYTAEMERKVIALQAQVAELFSELLSLDRENLDLEVENEALKKKLKIAGLALLSIELRKKESDREFASLQAQYLHQQLQRSGQQRGASSDRGMEKVQKSSSQRPLVGTTQSTPELERNLKALKKAETAEMLSKLEALERKALDLYIENAAIKEMLESAKQASLEIQRGSSLPFISFDDAWTSKVEKEESDREEARARASVQAE